MHNFTHKEEWIVKMMKFAKMAKLITLIRDRILPNFNADWKPFIDILHETKQIKLWFVI